MKQRVLLSPAFSALTALVLGGVVYFALDSVIPDSARFFILTLLMLYYPFSEMRRVWLVSPDRWLINPAVLCSVVTFILPFGIANIIYLFPDEKTIQVGLYSSISPAMLKIMMLTLLAAGAMWTGYWSGFAFNQGRMLLRVPLVVRLNYAKYVPRPSAIIVSMVVVLLVRLSMITFGVFGYSTSGAGLEATASFRQYLSTIELLSKFILLAISLHYFSSPSPDRTTKRLLILVVVFEIAFGFLSGMKSSVVMPVVLVGICYYYCNNKLNMKLVPIAIILLLLAYTVIEPFRAARYEDKSFTNTSLASIVTTFINSISESVGPETNRTNISEASAPLAILARSSMVYISSLGVEFKDTGQLPDNSPAFLKDIILSPLYAVVPRALWGGKESSRHGQWYVQEVMGFHENNTTSVGMSPFTYLYFAGGWLAVFLGFFFVGIVQRVVAITLLENGGVVYLMILTNLVGIDSVFYTFIVDSLRIILIIAVFFMVIYQRVDTIMINSSER